MTIGSEERSTKVGLILRDSQYKGKASLEQVLARGAIGPDRGGPRQESVEVFSGPWNSAD